MLKIFTLDYVIHDSHGKFNITPHRQNDSWGSFFVPVPLDDGIGERQ